MDATTANYNGYKLQSAFQPILSLCHRRSVGYESLLRTTDGGGLLQLPGSVLHAAAESNDIRQLDTLCQSLHIRNFSSQAPDQRWLFLNLEPSTIADRGHHDSTLIEALRAAGVPPEKIVIEFVEGAIRDESKLFAAAEYFRSIGALVALDDFGAGHSNFDRIWRLAPDIIKLDRSLIVEAEQHRTGRLRRTLPNLVTLIHEAGCLVLAEGIETREQAVLAMESDADFVQGFYFARPSPTIDRGGDDYAHVLYEITQHFETAATTEERIEADRIAPYIEAFRATVKRIEHQEHPYFAARDMMRLPRAARFYILNTRGEETMHIHGRSRQANHRLKHIAPVIDTSGGTWYRRQYFRAAIASPHRLQTSPPYLSSTGAYMCVTLSLADTNPPERVICCDIDW